MMRWLVRRPPAPRPYQPNGKMLTVSKAVLDTTVRMLTRYRGVETCCYWYGERGELASLVCGVAVPHQISAAQNYTVPGDAIAEVVDALPDPEWRILAQVHSHPGQDVEHSVYDDEMAISRAALSLVVPYYARDPVPWMSGVGVHEFQVDYWHRLSRRHAEARIALSPDGECWWRDFR